MPGWFITTWYATNWWHEDWWSDYGLPAEITTVVYTAIVELYNEFYKLSGKNINFSKQSNESEDLYYQTGKTEQFYTTGALK